MGAVGTSGRQPLFMDEARHVITSYKLARDMVRDRWESTWSEDLPCAQPKMRGHVRKTAVASQNPTITMSLGELEQYTFEKLPVYSGCQV